MLTGWPQSVATMIAAACYYALDFALMARYDRYRRTAGSGRSWGYTLAMLLAAGFLIAQPAALPLLGWSTPAVWGTVVQAAGILLMAAGLALHAWARVHLRQYYAERVELQTDHQVVDTGPYAVIRHPVFTSFFLSALGLLLVNPAAPTALLAAYAFWDFGRAAGQEETLLSRSLPGYAEYLARTGRFWPRIPSPGRRVAANPPPKLGAAQDR